MAYEEYNDYIDDGYDPENHINVDDISDEELLNKMRKQTEEYEKQLKKMKEAEREYREAKEECYKKHDRRRAFELNLNKSNLEGDTIIERLGYDADAKKHPEKHPELHMMERFIDNRVKNPNMRIAIYIGIIIICLGIIVIPRIFG